MASSDFWRKVVVKINRRKVAKIGVFTQKLVSNRNRKLPQKLSICHIANVTRHVLEFLIRESNCCCKTSKLLSYKFCKS